MNDRLAKPVAAVSACVWHRSQVLMVKRPTLEWSLPGGHLEPGEEANAAAHRELLEETGVTAGLAHFLGHYNITARGRPYVIACFGGLWVSGKIRAASDAQEARWMAPGELAVLHLRPSVADAISRMAAILKL